MTNKERLDMLRLIYGPNVVCTNGLFHIIEDNHREIYITKDNELDRRTSYATLEVTDKSVLAIDLSKNTEPCLGEKLIREDADITDLQLKMKGTVLLIDKNTLDYKYKTTNQIEHIKNDIFLVFDNSNSEVIDNNGKVMLKLDNFNSLLNIGNNLYICEGNTLFSDKLIIIDNKNRVLDITKTRSYRIKFLNNNRLRIELRSGGAYILDLKTKEYFNVFTGKIETNLNLFDIAI